LPGAGVLNKRLGSRSQGMDMGLCVLYQWTTNA